MSKAKSSNKYYFHYGVSKALMRCNPHFISSEVENCTQSQSFLEKINEPRTRSCIMNNTNPKCERPNI